MSLAKSCGRVQDVLKAGRLIAPAALQQRSASRAIEYLKPIVDMVPADAATLTVLGNAYMADAKPDLALQQFEKAAALDPHNPATKTRLGLSAIGIGQGQHESYTTDKWFPPLSH